MEFTLSSWKTVADVEPEYQTPWKGGHSYESIQLVRYLACLKTSFRNAPLFYAVDTSSRKQMPERRSFPITARCIFLAHGFLLCVPVNQSSNVMSRLKLFVGNASTGTGGAT